MTENVVSADLAAPVFIQPKPSPSPRTEKRPDAKDPATFIGMATQLVVDNYNRHRDAEKSPELMSDGVYIVWFAKTLGNWHAIVASPVVRGLIWEVTSNGYRNEVYVEVYKKVNGVKIVMGGSS